jgi:hypothetical protein
MPIHYIPPTPEDLRNLKDQLGYTGEQMADLFGLAGNNQWRKYTGGHAPRPMSLPMLFLAGAMLHPNKRIADVFAWCQQIGAKIEIHSSPDGGRQSR